MPYLEPVSRQFGLTSVEGLFRAYETTKYRRALNRGFGICSQNALGLASLLEDRYGIKADLIGQGGHVVVEAEGYLLDPSVRLALPFPLAEAEKCESEAGEISAIYEAAFLSNQAARVYGFNGALENITRFVELGQFYNAESNQRIGGVKDCRPKLYWLERLSDWLKRILPALILLVGVLGFRAGRSSHGQVKRS